MNLQNLKSLLLKSIYCEIDFLQKGNIDCANKMLQYRRYAHMNIYKIECMLNNYPSQNKTLVEHLMEETKEIIQMITLNKC